MNTRWRGSTQLTVALGLLAFQGLASVALAQTPVSGLRIRQFVNPLPVLYLSDPAAPVDQAGLPAFVGTAPSTLSICEFQSQILPPPLRADVGLGLHSG